MRRPAFPVVPLLSFTLALAACSAGNAVDRTVAVRMSDDMRYDPGSIEVRAGETVRFEVENVGRIRHEFVIGDAEAQAAHAEEMRHGGHGDEGHADPAMVGVDPGETAVLTHAFEEPGDLLVACHEPGHYEAGMVAPISVSQ